MRTNRELRSQYELEKRLADELRHASREERLHLYPKLYDELYRKVPYLKTNPITTDQKHLAATFRILKPFLGQNKTFLEIGAGNLAVSRMVAPYVKQVLALDVSQEFASALGPVPPNVKLIISDGLSVPIEPKSVDIAYSSQLMEHLHPDDALEQLQNIKKTLKPNGSYLCITPHRFNGPHDISQFFDQEATGFHLKEYTNGELALLFKKTGFRMVYALTGARGYVLPMPVSPLIWLEKLLGCLPFRLRRSLASFFPIKAALGIRLVAKR